MTRRSIVLATSDFGGKLILDLSPVHAHRCPMHKTPWQENCCCGASDLVVTRDQLVAAIAALTNREVTTR